MELVLQTVVTGLAVSGGEELVVSEVTEFIDIFIVRVENYMTLKLEMGKVNNLGTCYFNALKVF